MSQADRPGALRRLLADIAEGKLDGTALEAACAELDGLEAVATTHARAEARLEQVAEALFRLAALDFGPSPPVLGDGSVLDAVAGCIGMLSEELQAHLDERNRVAQELEDRVRARTAEVAASAERYRTLVESTQAIPWEASCATLELTYIAPQAEAFFGRSVERLVGSDDIWSFVYADDRERVRGEIAALARREHSHADLEYRIVGEDQRVTHVRSIVAAPISRGAADGHDVLRGISFDVTRQKKLESELSRAQKLESVGRLAAGIAHEINTPIQFASDSVCFVREAMRDMTGALEGYRAIVAGVAHGDSPFTAIAHAAEIEESSDLAYLLANIPSALERALNGLQRVAVIVGSMKEFSHPMPREMGPVDLNRVIESILVMAQHEYRYVADVHTELGDIPLVRCHGGDLGQAILNIIVNASHAIAEASQFGERGRISIVTSRHGDSAVVAISDTGGGIPDAIRDRIFDPFFTTKELGKGTGQGLAVARAIVEERHGGELRFETELGRGTTFFLRLPADDTAPDPAPARSSR
ncbi:MAG: ATP-binding protein [Myxococcota bacterium]